MFLRPCERDDIPAVRKLLSYFSETPATDNELWLCVSLFRHRKKYFVVEWNGCVVGVGALSVENKLHHCPLVCCHIEDIVIDEKYRKMGVGRFLVKSLIEEARQLEAYSVKLTCSEENVAFYNRLGFIRNGVSMKVNINEDKVS